MNEIPEFVARHREKLEAFVRLSQTAGRRSDYVQGGGGNTSCKVDETLMAIKASGYRLDQIELDKAYAVLDYQILRRFYLEIDPETLKDVEQEGSARVKEAMRTIDGIEPLRPSVEAGFHSLLDTYVLHTHPVYANLAACSEEGEEMAAKALSDLSARYVFVPYINPGAQLTFAIRREIQAEVHRSGKRPGVLFLQNHGLVITGGDADRCLELHDSVNERIAAVFGVSPSDWPVISVLPVPAVETKGKEQAFQSNTPWLRERLIALNWDLDLFANRPLYPDQLVFLDGQLGIVADGTLAEALQKEATGGQRLPDKCTIFRESGEIFYRCSQNEARTIEETLCAVLFIHEAIKKAGKTVRTMGEAEQQFISSWESEAYRKNIAAR